MSDKIKLVQGDTGPQIRLTLLDDTSGNPIDLSGSTVTLHFRAIGGETALFSRQAYVSSQDAAAGKAVISWEEGDLDVEAGEYEGEIEVFWPSTGIRQTIYDLLKFKVRSDVA
jgi:hypothetical protein